MRKMAALIAVAAALGFAPRHASAQTLITCESVSGRTTNCRADVSGGVTVHRQLSSTDCVQGRNWNISRTGIWVSNGCRAQFLVNNGRNSGRYNNGRYDNNGRYNDNDGYNNGRYNDDRNLSRTELLCRRAVQAQLGRRTEVSTRTLNGSMRQARVGWRLANGRSGECRIDSNSNVSVLVNRNR